MNIGIEKFVHIIEKGWSLDHLYILQNIEGVAPSLEFPKGRALIQALHRKGVVDEELNITPQGKMLLEFVLNEKMEDIPTEKKPKIKDGIESLHNKLEAKLIELTGKKQMMASIGGTKYPFLCNDKDLQARVKKVMKKYQLSDFQLIENTLLKYVEKCYKRNNWFPIVIYYISKLNNGTEISQLVTDLSNMENIEGEKNKTDFEI